MISNRLGSFSISNTSGWCFTNFRPDFVERLRWRTSRAQSAGLVRIPTMIRPTKTGLKLLKIIIYLDIYQ